MLAVNPDAPNGALANKSVICNAAYFLHQLMVGVLCSVELRGKLKENNFSSAVSIIRVESCYRKLIVSLYVF